MSDHNDPDDGEMVIWAMAIGGPPVEMGYVVGPFWDNGSDEVRLAAPSYLIDGYDEALRFANELAENASFPIRVVVFPLDQRA